MSCFLTGVSPDLLKVCCLMLPSINIHHDWGNYWIQAYCRWAFLGTTLVVTQSRSNSRHLKTTNRDDLGTKMVIFTNLGDVLFDLIGFCWLYSYIDMFGPKFERSDPERKREYPKNNN